MTRRRLLWALAACAAGAGLLLGAEEALARVGGGQSYGGGGGSSGSSGGGGGDALILLIRFLLWLCLEHPAIGIPLTLCIVGYFTFQHLSEGSQKLNKRRTFRPKRARRAGPDWARLKQTDPDFSRVLLIDFLTRLCQRFQVLQGEGDIASLRPYLSESVYRKLQQARARNEERRQTFSEVVLGSVHVKRLTVAADGSQTLAVDFELNFATARRGGRPVHYYARHGWRLERGAGAKSPTPQSLETLGCPNCGAPVDLAENGACSYCDSVIDAGRLSWRITGITRYDQRRRHEYNVNLGGGVEEGTELPDVIDPDLTAGKRALGSNFDWEGFRSHAEAVFRKLQAAWSAGSWEQARPYETDTIFQSHRFYLEHLAAKGLTNKIDAIRGVRVRVVRVERDRWFDAITVRIHASAKDYTLDRRGKVVAGSRGRARRFSEYWTFVRSRDYTPGQGPGDVNHCPNCGAPLDRVNMAGVCEYCDSTITSGQFSWVLSLIEQDEAYQG